jgi:hypothetical protein
MLVTEVFRNTGCAIQHNLQDVAVSIRDHELARQESEESTATRELDTTQSSADVVWRRATTLRARIDELTFELPLRELIFDSGDPTRGQYLAENYPESDILEIGEDPNRDGGSGLCVFGQFHFGK